jgi:hypothetical protein
MYAPYFFVSPAVPFILVVHLFFQEFLVYNKFSFSQTGQVGVAVHLYTHIQWFCLRFLTGILLSFSWVSLGSRGKMPLKHLDLRHDPFLPDPLQPIIHQLHLPLDGVK